MKAVDTGEGGGISPEAVVGQGLKHPNIVSTLQCVVRKVAALPTAPAASSLQRLISSRFSLDSAAVTAAGGRLPTLMIGGGASGAGSGAFGPNSWGTGVGGGASGGGAGGGGGSPSCLGGAPGGGASGAGRPSDGRASVGGMAGGGVSLLGQEPRRMEGGQGALAWAAGERERATQSTTVSTMDTSDVDTFSLNSNNHAQMGTMWSMPEQFQTILVLVRYRVDAWVGSMAGSMRGSTVGSMVVDGAWGGVGMSLCHL